MVDGGVPGVEVAEGDGVLGGDVVAAVAGGDEVELVAGGNHAGLGGRGR